MILRRPAIAERVVRLPSADPPVLSGAVVTREGEVAELTTSRTRAWLAAADAATREAVATDLAPELTALAASARQRGYDEGYAAGEQAASVDRARAIQLLAKAAEAFAQAREAAATSLEPAVADLVTQAFLKLAGAALVPPAATVGAVREALRDLAGETRVRVRVHPADVAAVAQAAPFLQQVLPGVECELVADETVDAGGCRVDTSLGTLDAAFDTQLTAALATLRAARAARRGGP